MLKYLYFAALIPPEAIKAEVLLLKQEVQESFGVKHALKLPAHITILQPFWLPASEEKKLIMSLEKLTSGRVPFQVELKDFGYFGQSTIFINVADPRQIRILHADLISAASDFLPVNSGKPLHPHMTIATRDITRSCFEDIWSLFKDRTYSASFSANSLHLLRHNTKVWEDLWEGRFLG